MQISSRWEMAARMLMSRHPRTVRGFSRENILTHKTSHGHQITARAGGGHRL